MFFLLRMAFWLTVVCVLLPGSGPKTAAPEAQINATEAMTLAGAVMSDTRGFCERQPEACVVGGKVAVALGHKAEAGARTLYDFIIAKLGESTGSADKPAQSPAQQTNAQQGTLTPADLAPAWHGPIPLPPRRAANGARPAA